MVKTLLSDTRGSAAVEYALALAAVALIAVTGVSSMAQAVAAKLAPAEAALSGKTPPSADGGIKVTITHDRDGFLDRHK